jgi:hypothetical protein
MLHRKIEKYVGMVLNHTLACKLGVTFYPDA